MTVVVEPAAVAGWLVPVPSQPWRFRMAAPQQPRGRCDDGRIEETVRRAKLHLSTASDILDCAASAVYRARELADERDGAGDELAEDIVAVRSSARMLVDVLSELKVAGLCPRELPGHTSQRRPRPASDGFVPRSAWVVTGSGGTFPAGTGLSSMPGPGKQTGAPVFLPANSRLGGMT
jgi:hypothetical protein